MTIPLPAQGGLLLALLALSAFFSSSETSLFSLDPLDIERLRERHPHVAARLDRLLADPTALLSAILIGNTFTNVTSAGLGFAIVQGLGFARAEAVAIVAMTGLLLIVGEITPKRYAMRYAVTVASLYAAPLTLMVRLLHPVQRLLEAITGALTRSPGGRRKAITEDEFLTVVEVGEEEGVLDEEERTMVDGIVGLEDSQASDIMTPRVDLEGIDLTDPPAEQEHRVRGVRFRYMPVYRETIDNIEGFLDVPRFLLAGGHDLKSFIIPSFAVPENAPLDTLLATFLREDRRIAVVVDEFGGTAGIITRGDILEEIAEDVDNEFGDQQLTIQQIGPNRWLVNGTVSLEDINYELDTELEAEGADRISGWIMAQTERIPHAGEAVEAQGCRATVQRLRKHRITLVLLEKLAPPETETSPHAESET